ncbi:MAG TPA: TIR domain-containing protein [Ktedonobacterales bacterium]|nr:TIR domain-containing protein [Ktedonobacterales bacterium]
MESASDLKDFFISYTGTDVDWAIWIAEQLEAAGYTTIYQARDFNAGGNFVVQMHQAMRQTKRTIAVLSPDYLEARFTLPEWAEAFRRDPTGDYALLVPVRVKHCQTDGILGAIVYIDLLGHAPPAMGKHLLEKIRAAASKPLPPSPAAPGKGAAPVAEHVIAPLGLPRAVSLIGRDEELTNLMAKLRAGDTMGVFALEGMGGIGKTALAAEVVARLAADQSAFPGGAAWIACEGLEGAAGLAEVWARVARALGLEQVATLADPQARRAALANALAQHQRLLLALDNIEPGLDADAVLDTLAVRGHTALLLTARQKVVPLRLRAIELAPLPPPDGASLFRERLGQIDAARPNAQDEPAIATLLAAVSGLPLAIELTASYAGLQRFSLERVQRELEQDGLNAAAYRIDPKKALLTRFERSWLALVPRQQTSFAGLALLAEGSFPRDAALAIARAADDQPDAPGDLLTLLSYALVEVLPGGERLRLHPLLREYAARKLEALPKTQQEKLGDAMVDFWLAYARAHPDYEGMDALEAEAAGLMGALSWAHERARHRNILRLVQALRQAWSVRGRRNESRLACFWALEGAKALDDKKGELWAAHELAVVDWQTGRLAEARVGYEHALELARQLGDRSAERVEVHSLALLDRQTGRQAEARAGYERALELARQLGDLSAERVEVHSLAVLDWYTGRLSEARAGYERALELARQLGDRSAEREEVHCLAVLDWQTGRLSEARAGYERALALAQQLRDPAAEAMVLRDFGSFLEQRSEPERGRKLMLEGLALLQRLNDVLNLGWCYERLAWLEQRQGNNAAAIAYFREALRCLEQVQSPDAEKVRARLRKLGAGEDQANT